MQAFARQLKLALEVFSGLLLVMLTLLVTVAAAIRFFGAGLSWYDEVAPILLTWVTYFGAALVALDRGHLGFNNIIRRFALRWRAIAFAFSELCTIVFFLALAWGGVRLLQVIAGERLMTIEWFPSAVAQSVIPIAAVVFVIAELVTLPMAWEKLGDHGPKADTDLGAIAGDRLT
jgi:TRAP-type C4-dicarboxylate transport system permease small subunit